MASWLVSSLATAVVMMQLACGASSSRPAPPLSNQPEPAPATDRASTAPTPIPVTGEVAGVLRELAALRDEMCVCKDIPCGEAVVARMASLGSRYNDLDADPHELAAATAIAEALTQCLMVLYQVGPTPGALPVPTP